MPNTQSLTSHGLNKAYVLGSRGNVGCLDLHLCDNIGSDDAEQRGATRSNAPDSNNGNKENETPVHLSTVELTHLRFPFELPSLLRRKALNGTSHVFGSRKAGEPIRVGLCPIFVRGIVKVIVGGKGPCFTTRLLGNNEKLAW